VICEKYPQGQHTGFTVVSTFVQLPVKPIYWLFLLTYLMFILATIGSLGLGTD